MRKLGLFSFSPSSILRRAVFFAILGCAYVSIPSYVVHAQLSARTLARGIDQLVDESQVIVRGNIISATVEPHPQLQNLTTVVVTMNVSDTYKGKAQKSLVFRQYIGNVVSHRVPSEYRKGQELLLLLRPTSEYGLTSPEGLEQGRFEVRVERGKRVAVNGRGNVGLFDQVSQRAKVAGTQLSVRSAAVLKQKQSGGPVPVEDLEELIRSLARVR